MCFRILLVEDSPDNQIIYRSVLAHMGYDVSLAPDGEAAIRMAREVDPALILMDMGLPLIDGWEATRILKADAATKHIPIIALTAHTLPSERARSTEAGCDGFIAKPAEPRKVVAFVGEWLAGHRPGYSA